MTTNLAEETPVTPGDNRTKQQIWDDFLRDLMSWQLHLITKDETELRMYDEYISGKKTLAKIYEEIITLERL